MVRDSRLKVCKHCGSDHIAPSRLKIRDYTCVKCRNAMPSQKAGRARWASEKYRTDPAWRATKKRNLERHIRVGQHPRWGWAQTPEQARLIEDHIRGRLRELKQRQSARAQIEGLQDGSD